MAYTGKIFSWDHNASEPILERLDWLTTALVRRDGSEQLAQPRINPRRELDYAILPISPSERAHLDNFVWASQKDNVLIPIWTDVQTLKTQANANQPDITINTVGYDYDAGHYVLLWDDYRNCEAVEIATVDTGGLVLAEDLLNSWPVGTVVVPARIGRISEKVDGNTYVPDARPYKVTCKLAEGSVSTNRIGAYTPQNYLGYEIWKQEPEVSEATPYSWQASFPLLDYQTGITGRDAGAREKPYNLFGYRSVMTNRAELAQWWAFLNRRQGKRVPFWLPSWERDFEAVLFQFGGIKYKTNGYADLINLAPGRRDIVVITEQATLSYPAGTYAPRRPTAAINNLDGTETLTVSMSDFGGNEYTKTRVSLLRFCRLEGDGVEIAWHSPLGAVCQVAMRETWHTP